MNLQRPELLHADLRASEECRAVGCADCKESLIHAVHTKTHLRHAITPEGEMLDWEEALHGRSHKVVVQRQLVLAPICRAPWEFFNQRRREVSERGEDGRDGDSVCTLHRAFEAFLDLGLSLAVCRPLYPSQRK